MNSNLYEEQHEEKDKKYKIFWKLHDILNELITKGLKIINRRTLTTKTRYIKYNNLLFKIFTYAYVKK